MGKGRAHSAFFVGASCGFNRSLFLAVAVHEHDGIIHGESELEDGSDGFGNMGDFGENEVGARVDEDGEADGEKEEERFNKRAAENDKNNHSSTDGENNNPDGNDFGIVAGDITRIMQSIDVFVSIVNLVKDVGGDLAISGCVDCENI